MAKRNVPTHPQGWKFSGADGPFRVWHAGKNDYRVTSPDGDVIAQFEQLSRAFHFAARQHSIDKMRNPRPRQYASAAERQAAYRARFVLLEARLDPTTADTLTRLAQQFDIPRAELLVQVIKQGLLSRNWSQLGPRSDLRSGAVQQGARATPRTRQEARQELDDGEGEE